MAKNKNEQAVVVATTNIIKYIDHSCTGILSVCVCIPIKYELCVSQRCTTPKGSNDMIRHNRSPAPPPLPKSKLCTNPRNFSTTQKYIIKSKAEEKIIHHSSSSILFCVFPVICNTLTHTHCHMIQRYLVCVCFLFGNTWRGKREGSERRCGDKVGGNVCVCVCG